MLFVFQLCSLVSGSRWPTLTTDTTASTATSAGPRASRWRVLRPTAWRGSCWCCISVAAESTRQEGQSGHKVGQIYHKWDKSASFSHRDPQFTEKWSSILPDLSNLGPIRPTFGPNGHPTTRKWPGLPDWPTNSQIVENVEVLNIGWWVCFASLWLCQICWSLYFLLMSQNVSKIGHNL